MKLVKAIVNPRVISALVSFVSAIVCACFAGCKLAVGKMSIDDFEASIFNSYYNTTNTVEVM